MPSCACPNLASGAGNSPTVPHARLDALLATVDPVKFARAPISAADARAVGEEAHAFVRTEHDEALSRAAAAAEAVTRTEAAA